MFSCKERKATDTSLPHQDETINDRTDSDVERALEELEVSVNKDEGEVIKELAISFKKSLNNDDIPGAASSMRRFLDLWNPVGKPESDIIKYFGKPNFHKPNTKKYLGYCVDNGAVAVVWKFYINDQGNVDSYEFKE